MTREPDETIEPSEGDYTLTPCGPLGGRTAVAVIGGKFLRDFEDDDAALAYVRARMDHEQFWPNVWLVSDHGNFCLVTA